MAQDGAMTGNHTPLLLHQHVPGPQQEGKLVAMDPQSSCRAVLKYLAAAQVFSHSVRLLSLYLKGYCQLSDSPLLLFSFLYFLQEVDVNRKGLKGLLGSSVLFTGTAGSDK